MRYITAIWNEIVTWCHGGMEPIDYGLLYNWYAATDVREITSAGWHLPTSTELYNLMRYIDPDGLPNNNDAGGHLKEIGIIYWNTPNTGATNTYGFNIRGAGNRHYSTGVYGGIGSNIRIWTSDSVSPTNASVGQFENSSAIFYMAYGIYNSNYPKKYGHSIRPIKDSTTLTHGQTGIYVDPSGYIYRTICIGTQEIVADNIVTEHYRNGDPIPIVTDNATWAALITGALCAYDNNWNNV